MLNRIAFGKPVQIALGKGRSRNEHRGKFDDDRL